MMRVGNNHNKESSDNKLIILTHAMLICFLIMASCILHLETDYSIEGVYIAVGIIIALIMAPIITMSILTATKIHILFISDKTSQAIKTLEYTAPTESKYEIILNRYREVLNRDIDKLVNGEASMTFIDIILPDLNAINLENEFNDYQDGEFDDDYYDYE